jgi:hypothetical protein
VADIINLDDARGIRDYKALGCSAQTYFKQKSYNAWKAATSHGRHAAADPAALERELKAIRRAEQEWSRSNGPKTR